jgi:hypothetical protein
MRLLEMAARRIVADLTTLRYTSTRVERLDGAVGPAIEVRAGHRETTSVVRLYAVPEGYCEVAIFGARSEEEVTAYFASAEIRP